MDGIARTNGTPPFLAQLRTEGMEWLSNHTIGDKVNQIIRYQSEFPVKIRKVIHDAQGLNPSEFLIAIGRAARSFTIGLDSNIDTEEEVEVAIRAFYITLFNWTLLVREGRNAWRPALENVSEIALNPFFNDRDITNLVSSFKTISFLPLFVQVLQELSGRRDLIPLTELIRNDLMLKLNPLLKSDEFDRLIDEAYLSVLIRLKDSGVMKKEHLMPSADIFYTKPSRFAKRLQFLIDWDPSCLKRRSSSTIRGPLLTCFLTLGYDRFGIDQALNRLEIILENGMLHYPKEIGFWFHRGSFGGSFRRACKRFGKQRVTELMNKLILKMTHGRSYVIRALIVAAASNPKVELDGLFFLIRQNPAMFILFASSSRKRKRM